MAGVLVRDNWVCLFVGKYVFYSIYISSCFLLPHSCLRPFYLLILPSPENGLLRGMKKDNANHQYSILNSRNPIYLHHIPRIQRFTIYRP